MTRRFLVRYGAVPEVARFEFPSSETFERGSSVIVRSHRGVELGTLLEEIQTVAADDSTTSDDNGNGELPRLLRVATDADLAAAAELRNDCETQYGDWLERIRNWGLELELIDLEWMLDKDKLVLYVLNNRGPDCTKLALQAAAAGLGVIEVQPVSSDGLVSVESSGGCGSGGGCGSCST